MKRGWLLLCFIGSVYMSYAQSVFDLVQTKEGKILIMLRQREHAFNFQIPMYIYKSYIPSASAYEMEVRLNNFKYTPTVSDVTERPMDMQIASTAYRPFFNIYAPMLRQVSPMAFDFRETSVVPLDDHVSLYASGSQYTWPGAGGVTTLQAGMAWNMNRFTVTGGGFGGRYFTPFNASPDFMAGGNLQLRYDATDWLSLRSWGQYTYYDKVEQNNPHLWLNPAFNHTSVGGAVELHLNDNFGIGVGMNYEFNPFKGKMERQYLIYPIFRSK